MMDREAFVVHCGKCSHEWALGFSPLSIDAFVKAAKHPCPVCGAIDVMLGPFPKSTPEGDPVAWLDGGDTGISSKTIWRVMMGRGPSSDWWGDGPPLDPSDFGRCYRLLKVMPSWRPRLPEVSAKFPKWTRLVETWDELTALYEEEFPKKNAPKLYARIQECLARKTTGA